MARLDAITVWNDPGVRKADERRFDGRGTVKPDATDDVIVVKLTARLYSKSPLPRDPEGWACVVTSRDGDVWPTSERGGLEVTEVRRELGRVELEIETGLAGTGPLPLP